MPPSRRYLHLCSMLFDTRILLSKSILQRTQMPERTTLQVSQCPVHVFVLHAHFFLSASRNQADSNTHKLFKITTAINNANQNHLLDRHDDLNNKRVIRFYCLNSAVGSASVS
ncbi:hypothetical protein L596_013913 [Steinernema carpocapsae]|uniref:Uncharacterized protein n=1 Tax=Steinernema carpocapsae TaxID=34508 RepID=A0A4U5P2Y8_STECR|nr:hypothetical protein L596_013913 [Steinernema carpocapsae]